MLITGTPFSNATNFVQVALRNGLGQTVTYFPVNVSFDLATGAGLATGSLSVTAKTTVMLMPSSDSRLRYMTAKSRTLRIHAEKAR